jgi:pSer/pThr/pTyr-binding forkhead associated (FHA) protein
VQPPGGKPEAGSATISGGDAARMGLLQLPKDKRFSLAVIQGAATGQIFPISKTRTLIGRSGADINLDDPESSRQHAALEIVGDVAILRDLGSTNGTWVELERIEQHQLGNQQEFRIGSHVLMFIVTDVE